MPKCTSVPSEQPRKPKLQGPDFVLRGAGNSGERKPSLIDQQLERAMAGYTLEQLHAGFDLVKPKPNWKYPIDAVVPADADTRLIGTAVTWFTGSLADIVPIRQRGKITGYHVTAGGYYACIGS